jgi:hypothetical protein
MLYRHKKVIKTYGDLKRPAGFSISFDSLDPTEGNVGKQNAEHKEINDRLGSIPTGKKTDNKTTYTRDDDPISIHNTPIFYHIDDDVMYLEPEKEKIHEEQVETYTKAIQRLTTNSVCNVMLRKIIGKYYNHIKEQKQSVQSPRLQTNIEIVVRLGNSGTSVTFPIYRITDDLCVKSFNTQYPSNKAPNIEGMQVQVNSNRGRYKLIDNIFECKGKLYKPNKESNDNNNLNMTIPETSSDNEEKKCVNAVNKKFETTLNVEGLKEGIKKNPVILDKLKGIVECKGIF